jgi:peptidylprolyl isomerase/FKBP-type peptidyl-prolyl cis-trans isomerase FklB
MRVAVGIIVALALAGPASAKDANAAFFARNAKAPGVKTIPGIQYKVLKSGPPEGPHPKRSSTVKVRYVGSFIDGKVFDSSKDEPDGAVSFPLGRLIPGWTTVVPMMRPGDEWEIYLPPEYAYGADGKDEIPGGAAMVFRIELLEVSHAPAA